MILQAVTLVTFIAAAISLSPDQSTNYFVFIASVPPPIDGLVSPSV